MEPERGTLVEGVGDEVVILLTFLFAAIGGCVLTCGVNATRSLRVHPEQEDAIANTRRDMGFGERQQEAGGGHGGGAACPVCLAPTTNAVQTNCGHAFCAQCVLAYWQHDQWPRAARCPMCRRQVTLLLPGAEFSADNSEAGRQLMTQVTDYNQRMSGEWRPLMHYLYDVPTLLRHLWRELFTIRGLLIIRRLHLLFILLLVVVYLLSPLDLLPEAVFGLLGLVDDVIIIVGTLVYIALIYRALFTAH